MNAASRRSRWTCTGASPGVAYLILATVRCRSVTVETLLTAFERGGSIRTTTPFDRALRVALKGAHGSSSSARIADLSLVGLRLAVTLPTTRRTAWPPRGARDPADQSAAVVLRYYADLSVDEVATALGKSPNTIKAQLHVALGRLRRSLAEPAIPSTETSHA